MKKNTRKMIAAFAAVGAMLAGMSACGGGDDSTTADGKIKLQFFQSKSESVDIVNTLIKEFEAENPNITVEQQNAADALTVLKSRITKNDIPDVIAVNVSNYYDVVQAEIMADQKGTDAWNSEASETALEYVRKSGMTDTDYMIPWSMNAQVVLYNKAQFEDLGLTVPTTWDEFLETADKVKAAGKTPFTFTWKDAWTAKPLLNLLAGPTQGDDFWSDLQSGNATFSGSDAYKTAANRMLTLKSYVEGDPFGTSYDDGNSAFANGESVMYIQGTWAIPVIKAANPDIELGAFVLPTSDEPNATELLAAPDSVIGISNSTKNAEAAQKFVDFMLSKEAQTEYSDDQYLFSVRDDVAPSDDALIALKSGYIDQGKICGSPDGMFNGASDLQGLTQTFMQDEDVTAYLKALDDDFAANGVK